MAKGMDTSEALRRVRLIVPMLRNDVRTAVLSHTVMEAANEIIPPGLKGIDCAFVGTYNAIQNALTLKLALDVARIFDVSDPNRYPPEGQDKASVQVLAALLGRPDIRSSLEKEAECWTAEIEYVGAAESIPAEVLHSALTSTQAGLRLQDREACSRTITELLDLAERLSLAEMPECGALVRVREFRNRRLAHSLFDKAPDEMPRYEDLNILVDVAKKAAELASMATEGLNIDFGEQVARDRNEAEGYSRSVLDGLKRLASVGAP